MRRAGLPALINRAPPNTSPEARDRYADAIEAQGPAWRNCAASIRAGFSNMWIEAALRAIDAALDDERPDHG